MKKNCLENILVLSLVMDFKKTNHAVIKSMFLQMDEKTFIKNAKDCKNELLNQTITLQSANYRFALLNLFKWLRVTYKRLYL